MDIKLHLQILAIGQKVAYLTKYLIMYVNDLHQIFRIAKYVGNDD